jgi:hypothetical protein
VNLVAIFDSKFNLICLSLLRLTLRITNFKLLLYGELELNG